MLEIRSSEYFQKSLSILQKGHDAQLLQARSDGQQKPEHVRVWFSQDGYASSHTTENANERSGDKGVYCIYTNEYESILFLSLYLSHRRSGQICWIAKDATSAGRIDVKNITRIFHGRESQPLQDYAIAADEPFAASRFLSFSSTSEERNRRTADAKQEQALSEQGERTKFLDLYLPSSQMITMWKAVLERFLVTHGLQLVVDQVRPVGQSFPCSSPSFTPSTEVFNLRPPVSRIR